MYIPVTQVTVLLMAVSVTRQSVNYIDQVHFSRQSVNRMGLEDLAKCLYNIVIKS